MAVFLIYTWWCRRPLWRKQSLRLHSCWWRWMLLLFDAITHMFKFKQKFIRGSVRAFRKYHKHDQGEITVVRHVGETSIIREAD